MRQPSGGAFRGRGGPRCGMGRFFAREGLRVGWRGLFFVYIRDYNDVFIERLAFSPVRVTAALARWNNDLVPERAYDPNRCD